MYHNVDQKAGFNTVSAENFERQLRFVQQYWQLTDMDTYVRECHSNPHLATVTFDDAYYCLYTYVRGVVDELRIPVTVFVPVYHVGGDNCWDEEELGYQKIDTLSWWGIEELSKNPLFTFGSHGMTHVSLRYFSKEETLKDLRESKEILEEHLQKSVDYYAFPFGQRKDFGYATPELLQEIGFKAAFTTLWKLNNLHENPYRFRRIEVRPTDTMEDFQRYLTRKIDFRYIKQQIKICRDVARRVSTLTF
jgi:peptidoglycan/xylan/chitin deacetylase (PgdA/CDA1 family)